MRYRVLIVDDQREFSRLLRSALETIEQGLDVTEAPSGEEALLVASLQPVDLLIADFRLPGITGLELMRKFRILNPQVKIIMITGISDPRLLQEVQNAGADAFFTKPVPMGDFLATVERTLGMTRTILARTETSAETQLPAPVTGLGELLSGLRHRLDSQAVLLLDNQGHVQAQAGELPDPESTATLTAALLGMSNAAQKAASLLEPGGSQLHLFRGGTLEALFLPVGSTQALFVAGKDLADAHKLAGRLDALEEAHSKILDALKNLGLTPEPAADSDGISPASSEPAMPVETVPGEFLSILNQLGQTARDADAFWESAIEKGTSYSEPDKLTYEQASRLGLTPDTPQKE